jgi:PhnB protein
MATRTKRAPKKTRKAKAATKTVQPIPAGYPAITPYLRIRGADRALEFYKKAFGAKEKGRMAGSDGRVMHAEMQVFNTVVMLSDEFPDRGALSPESLKGSPVGLFVYSRDVDAAIARAVAAGATVTMPAQDMFWGDRFGTIRDPFGHDWQFATHKEDVAPKEMQRRFQAMQAQQRS